MEHKIAEGNVKGAVEILSSSDTLAPQNIETFQRLQEKHPIPSIEMNLSEPPSESIQSLVTTEREVVWAIKGFPKGSAAGIDGLLPQHLNDLTLPSTGEAGLKLIKKNSHRKAKVLRIDFRNAFNEIDRGIFLTEM